MHESLDEKRISFISCVNNEELYDQCKYHISKLIIPEGLYIDFIPIRGAGSMCSGYNQAIGQSNAKYKVYLHQDAFIINPYFIRDLLSTFSDKSIGLVGLIGARELPESGIWWEADEKFGWTIDTHDSERYAELHFEGSVEKLRKWPMVAAVDGFLIATQYDLPWREDYFSWHFYDASQCMEFYRAGYSICVPLQEAPWCFHHCGPVSTEGYMDAQTVFLSLYSESMASQRMDLQSLRGKFKEQAETCYRPNYLSVRRPAHKRSLAYVEYRLLTLIRSIFRKLDPSGKGWRENNSHRY